MPLALRQLGPMDSIIPLLSDPAAWAALVTLVILEVVLGIDNLIFISILSNKRSNISGSLRGGSASALH